jgi:hypothetical protein
LGEFSHIGRLFSLGSFLMTEVSQILAFSTVKVMHILILTTNKWFGQPFGQYFQLVTLLIQPSSET